MNYLASKKTDSEKQNALVEFRSVSKKFDAHLALDKLDLTIYKNEFLALLGPSGCGKTTLLRLLAGFESATSGQILLEGSDINPLSPRDRPVNMMFQSYALFPHLSVYENIAFGLRRSNLSKDAIHQRVDEMLSMMQIVELRNRQPDQLSGGQRQRVALARSLARNPKILLLDEPLAALDKSLRSDTQFELMEIQAKTGGTFIIVTHDQEEAMTVATRIGLMNKGRIVQVGTPKEIYENPSSQYVARFIGVANVLSGRIRGNALFVTSLGLKINLNNARSTYKEDKDLYFTIRPEKINIYAYEPKAKDINSYPVVIKEKAYLGHSTIYTVALPSGDLVKVESLNLDSDLTDSLKSGVQAWVSWEKTACVILDQ